MRELEQQVRDLQAKEGQGGEDLMCESEGAGKREQRGSRVG